MFKWRFKLASIGDGRKIQTGGGRQLNISLQLNVRLTSNQAVFISLSVVLRSIKKLINLDLGGTLEGLLSARFPQNQSCRANFRVHLGVHEGSLLKFIFV